MANGNSFRWLVLAVSLMLWSGCSLQPLQQQQSISGIGRIEYRRSQKDGVVVGVPHGLAEPAAVGYADGIAARTGAGVVIAYGFGSKRVPVSEPLVRRTGTALGRRGSIYPEFKSLLQRAANGPLRFYIGIRVAGTKREIERIEVASSGLSFEQLRALKEKFYRRRDVTLAHSGVARIAMALEPLDEIDWDAGASKHHGVLLAAERGLSVRLPTSVASGDAAPVYRKILAEWTEDAVELAAQRSLSLPRYEVVVLPHGKIEAIPSRRRVLGVVVGAPHGTFDVHTARVVRRICHGAGLAGVIATGFTPTESGDDWRINVNRPSERHVSLTRGEIQTARAKTTFERFKKSVLAAAGGQLDLYVDIHQNAGTRIEVASVGLSSKEAQRIKDMFRSLRDQALVGRRDIAVVDLAIEPLDELEVGAWPVKADGILKLAAKGLHFELPADGVMASEEHRRLYTLILTQLLSTVAGSDSTDQASANLPAR